MSRARTQARLAFSKGRAETGRLTHKVAGCTIYWYDGKPKHVYVTWECGNVSPRVPGYQSLSGFLSVAFVA